jgi:hypothetical protein
VSGDRYQIQFGGESGDHWLLGFDSYQLNLDRAIDLEQVVSSLLVLLFAASGSILGRLLFYTRGESVSPAGSR